MRRKIRGFGTAALDTATKVWTEAPVAALFLFAVIGYLTLCLAIYPASQHP